MANATQAQVKALDAAMMDLFYHLVSAASFRIAIASKYGMNSAQFKKYNSVFVSIVRKWVLREVKYERQLLKKHIKGIISSGDLIVTDFYTMGKLPKLISLLKKWNADKTQSGIGFIPILVWAVIALAGFFSATVIVDDLTTTTQERAELLRVTQQTARDLGLSPEQAQALIMDTQKEATKSSGGLGDTVTNIALGLGVLFVGWQVLKPAKAA